MRSRATLPRQNYLASRPLRPLICATSLSETSWGFSWTQPVRLLAAVVAKNCVGSSWRKTVDSREWSRVSDEEKQAVQQRSLHALLNDPSDRVAVQIAILVANIARYTAI